MTEKNSENFSWSSLAFLWCKTHGLGTTADITMFSLSQLNFFSRL